MPTSKHSKCGRSWLTFLRLEGRLDENPEGRRLRSTRVKILTLLPGTVGALAVFGGPPKKRPVRLRFSAGPKKAADTFTVFGRAKKDGRYVYGFYNKSHL